MSTERATAFPGTKDRIFNRSFMSALIALCMLATWPTFAAEIHGQVTGAGAPIAGSTVTLWAAGSGVPSQLAQATSGDDGRFILNADGNGADLYLVAIGGRAAA